MEKCPKCGKESGDDWSQCKGSCPMPMSPHHPGQLSAPETVKAGHRKADSRAPSFESIAHLINHNDD